MCSDVKLKGIEVIDSFAERLPIDFIRNRVIPFCLEMMKERESRVKVASIALLSKVLETLSNLEDGSSCLQPISPYILHCLESPKLKASYMWVRTYYYYLSDIVAYAMNEITKTECDRDERNKSLDTLWNWAETRMMHLLTLDKTTPSDVIKRELSYITWEG
ncbi:hypothetical protein ACOME3_008539 [Neoechinorhynchus agilis]